VLAELTDSLIERAQSLRTQADELAREMQDAMRAIVAAPANAPEGAEGPEPPRERQAARETPAMRAARMAIAGSARHEIAEALRREYAIRDPEPILNEVLGRDG
jgi:hypothetical protein